MNKLFIFAALTTSLLFTACSSDEEFNDSERTSTVSFKVEKDVTTRTTTYGRFCIQDQVRSW